MISTKRWMITLGAGSVAVAPLATLVACNGPSNKVHSLDTTKVVTKFLQEDLNKISQLPAYSVDSMRAEAQKNGFNAIWRGSLQQESIAQGLNVLYQLADVLGYDFNNYVPDKATEKAMNVITDDMALLSDSELLAKLNITDATSDQAKTAIHLKNIKPKAGVISDIKKMYTLKLSPGNQTIDGDGDFDAMNLESIEQGSYVDGQPLHGLYLMNTWYSANGDENIVFADKGDNLVRRVINKNASQKYVVIKDETDFAENYLPFVSGIITNFLGALASSGSGSIDVDMLATIIGTPLANTIKFIVSKFSTSSIDEWGTDIVTIDLTTNSDSKTKLAKALLEVNKRGTVNWLAVKSFYLGFDDTFSKGGYERWTVNGDWQVNNAFDGIKNFQPSDLISIGKWQHGSNQWWLSWFNPSLSLQENIDANEKAIPDLLK